MTHYSEEEAAAEGPLEAKDVADVAGACPPREIGFRIYKHFDFNEVFALPPPTVITK